MAMTWVLEISFDNGIKHPFSRQLFLKHVESQQFPSRNEHNPASLRRAPDLAPVKSLEGNIGVDSLEGQRRMQDED